MLPTTLLLQDQDNMSYYYLCKLLNENFSI